MIRTIWVLVAGVILTMVLASGVVLSAWFRRPSLPCVCRDYPRFWARTLIRWSGVTAEVSGLDRVDWDRPMILVANHQSWFDVFVLVALLPAKLRFVAKEELSRIPVFGRAWRACGHVSVNRQDREDAIASLERAAARIHDESLAVIFFPEGTRSKDGRLQKFKKGAFVLAIQTQAPVVPVGIVGSHEVMPKGSFWIRPGHIRVEVGEAISTQELDHAHRNALLDKARDAVAALMEKAGRAVSEPQNAQPDTTERVE